MTTGTIQFFNATKGFGLFARNDGGKDASVHISAVDSARLTGFAEG